jgi:hypothetical protein
MLTVTNKLDTCLVVPEGNGHKGALFLEPKGTAQVERITASLKEAERNGQVVIRYPAGEKPEDKPTGARRKKDRQESEPC